MRYPLFLQSTSIFDTRKLELLPASSVGCLPIPITNAAGEGLGGGGSEWRCCAECQQLGRGPGDRPPGQTDPKRNAASGPTNARSENVFLCARMLYFRREFRVGKKNTRSLPCQKDVKTSRSLGAAKSSRLIEGEGGSVTAQASDDGVHVSHVPAYVSRSLPHDTHA